MAVIDPFATATRLLAGLRAAGVVMLGKTNVPPALAREIGGFTRPSGYDES